MIIFVTLVVVFLVSFAVSGLVCRIVRARPIYDDAASEQHKTHVGTIATGGGLGIWLGVSIPAVLGGAIVVMLVFWPTLQEYLPDIARAHLPGLWSRLDRLAQLLGLGSILAVLGTLDDHYKLNWKIRLLVQTLVAVAAVGLGFRFTLFLDMPIVTGFLSVLWIVALTNSFNMLDNMDGLSAGVAAICAAFLAAVMFLAPVATGPQLFIAAFLALLLGALAGFLLFNNPFRASLFMGDGGAYFLGFILAAITLVATYNEQAAPKPQLMLVPLLILAVPLYDTITVVTIRLREGRSPFVGDKSHYSHRLVQLGLSRRNAVLTIYLTTTVCCCGALLLYQIDEFGAVVIGMQTLLMLALIAILESRRTR